MYECSRQMLVKYLIAHQMFYLEQMQTRPMSHADIYYWQYHSELIQPQHFLDVGDSHHICHWLFFLQYFQVVSYSWVSIAQDSTHI